MGNWFTNIFTGKAPEKVLDIVGDVTGGIINGIDAIWETDEERAEHAMKIAEMKIKAAERIADVGLKTAELSIHENTAKSMTRRMITVSFVTVYLTLYVAGSIIYFWDPEHSAFLFKTAKGMHPIITPITIFYFGYYAVSNVMRSKK